MKTKRRKTIRNVLEGLGFGLIFIVVPTCAPGVVEMIVKAVGC